VVGSPSQTPFPAMSQALVFLFPLALLASTSCGLTDTETAGGKPVPTKVSRLSQFSLKDLRPSQIRIVDVREQDLKDLPLGDERAIAYQSSAAKIRASRSWISTGPVDFIEPELPDVGAEMDAGLLPPKPN